MLSLNISKRLLLVVIVAPILLMGTKAYAQVTGDLVEPDVLLLIDSSASMDWRDNRDPTGTLNNYYWSKQACDADLNTSAGKTSWQKMLDAFLGDIDGSNYQCAVEPPVVRPSLHAIDPSLLEDFLADDNANGIPDNIGEFRDNVSWPHFRAVSCPEDASDPTNLLWNQNPAGQYQCIDLSAAGDITDMPDGFYCKTADIYTIDGIDYCHNMHPEAIARQANGILDRFENTARFGFMSYDTNPAACTGPDCTDHDRLFDYGACRDWIVEGGNTMAQYNAGARMDLTGSIGGMVRIRDNLQQANQEVRAAMETMEPLFCSPLGALIDDAGYYFSEDQRVLPRIAGIDGNDNYYRCRPKIAVLITDGKATQEFEFGTGTCTGSEADWRPDIDNDATGCVTNDGSYIPDADGRNCPWRSSPEEAAELYDVGQRVLTRMAPSSSSSSPNQPILLVVIGFNVPDVDCEADPDSCFEYTPEYYDNRHCWEGLPPCDDGDDAGPEGTTCLMNPRQFVNEIACQGWPYDPERSFQGHQEDDFTPPWHPDNNLDICEPSGGTAQPENYICKYGERALFVNNKDKLATALSLVINNISATSTTRTELVAYNLSTQNVGNGQTVQYEFRTGYTKKQADPWKGVLTRADVGCGTSGAWEYLEFHDVAESMESQTNRTFYAMSTPDGNQAKLDEDDYNDLTPTNMATWIGQTPSGFSTESIASSSFDDCDIDVQSEIGGADCDGITLVKEELIQKLEERGLADIMNSTPAVLAPPIPWNTSGSFGLYANDNSIAKNRKPYLFVGTNDGVLHAFDIDAMDNGSPDDEQWAYMPRSLLKQVRDHFPMPEIIPSGGSYSLGDEPLGGLHQQMILMDGTPIARDVLMARDLEKLTEESGDQWRAVVFGGTGKGSRTYYALDVTESVKSNGTLGPSVLWELSPGDELYANNNITNPTKGMLAQINKMGYPISKPALAYVSDIRTGLRAQVAAAILPGGWRSDEPNVNTGVYIARLGDGKILKYLEPGPAGADGMCPDSIGLTESSGGDLLEFSQLVGEPVVLGGTLENRRARSAFIGDDRGRLWMIDMAEEEAEDWCLRLYFDTMVSWHFPYEECWPRHPSDPANDPYSSCNPSPTTCFHSDCCATPNGDPVVPASHCALDPNQAQNMNGPRVMILGAPTIAKNRRNEPVLVFGTGQYDELATWNRNRIFSLTDKIDADGVHYPEINWWVGDLGRELTDTAFPDYDPPSENAALGIWLAETEAEMAETQITAPWTNTQANEPKYLYNVGEKMIGRPTVFDGVAYFTSFVPIEDPAGSAEPCLAGTSRIWAVKFDAQVCDDSSQQGCEYSPSDFEDPYDTPLGEFIENDQNRLFRNYPSELFTGVKVIRRPAACDDQPGGDVFELVTQKATSPSTSGGPPTPGGKSVDVQKIKLDKNASATVTSVKFDSWLIVFE